MTTRRGFLGAILAAGVAPAFVGSSILMPVRAIARPKLDATRIVSALSGLRTGERFSIQRITGMDGAPQLFVVASSVTGVITLSVPSPQ